MNKYSNPPNGLADWRRRLAVNFCVLTLALMASKTLSHAQIPDDALPPDPSAADKSVTAPRSGNSNATPRLDSSLPADPPIAPQLGNIAQPFKLYGGVSHSETLPHVDQAIDQHRDAVVPVEASKTSADTTDGSNKSKLAYIPMTGVAQPTNESAKQLSAQVQKYTAEWFMIPSWMAGRWMKPGDLTMSVTDLRNGQHRDLHVFVENRMQATWGHQKDAAGNIWHVNFLPSERDGQSEGKMVRFLTTKQNCEKTDTQQLITRTQYVVSESDIWSGQAIDMFQQESLNHYMLGPNDTLVNNSTNRVFTYDGQPVRDGQLKSEYDRLTGFVPTQSLNGFDLKASLNDYLETHGFTNLKTP